MGQIVGLKAKPKRCNLNKLSQLGTPAAGEYILVSYDNSMTANGQGNFDRYIMGDGRTAATALELKYLDDSTRPYIVEEVNKAVADIQPIEITGDVTNAPDEEDLTSENQGGTDVLKFKDKAYNSALYSGLGRVYLRKNIVTLEGTGKNVLTQAMVNTANTIYHIQYDYDLNGQTITLPAGCVLEFDGGSVKNGTLKINRDNCALIGNGEALNVSVEVGVLATGCKNLLIKGLNFDGDRTLQDGIYCPTSSPCHQIIIADCTIHGYTRNGINISGRNLLIKDNLLFNNGTGTITENAKSGSGVDIVAGNLTGASENFSNIPNIIVKGNKCLSSEVDRHIDSGELYAETNILIEGNICVSMDATAENEVSDTFARHGIMVGYNGTSNLDKYANISNNVVKYGRWSGIYIRANNSSPETKGTTKYVVTCTGNYIYGISLHDDSGNMGGIACELRDGSIVANNTIKNCVGFGINLGFVFTDGETKVSDNYIEATDRGIYVDTYSQKYDIFHNTIIASVCVAVSTASATAQPITYDNYGSICNNILYPKIHGINVDQALADTVTISGNIIKYDTTTRDSNGIGIRIRQYNVNELKIESNTITDAIKGISIYRITGAYRDDIAFINANVIARATQGVECVNGNTSYILPIFNTQFINCTTNFPASSGIIPALSKDGEKCVFYTQHAIIESAKEWRVGDVIIANNGLVYSIAVCQVAATKTNGVPTAFTSKWSVFGWQGANEEGNIKKYAYRGSIFYNTSKNLPAYFSGASWYGFNNYTLNKTFGTTAERPTLAANANKGFVYYDTTLNQHVWWDGTKWLNTNDFILSLHQGTTANRPNFQPSEGDIGYPYYDTDLMRQLFMSSGQEQALQISVPARVDSSTPSRQSQANTLQSNKKYWVGYSIKQSWGGKMAFRKTDSVEATDADEIIILPNFNEAAQGRLFTSPDPSEYPYIYTESRYSLAEVLTFEIVVPYWIEQDGAKAGVLRHGATADRPASTDIYVGFEYFDETLGKPIYWNGTAYVDATGTAV